MMMVLSTSSGLAGPCDGSLKGALWCDQSRSFKQRAADIVANLTIEEKSGLFVNQASAVPRLELPAYNWWSEALHGVARDGLATSFPQICGAATSLNRSLWFAMGETTGIEARGKNNDRSRTSIYQGLTMWAPNVNIFRDPRWGRGEETPGEDPTINGEYAVSFVSGMQGPPSGKYVRAAACLKHYAAYNEETGRLSFPAVVTAQDMEDTFLPAFEAGVERGHAVGIMCSYNAETYGYGLLGPGSTAQHGAIPSCANKYLMNDLARDTWGFDGYITSDCGAVSGVANDHGYSHTPAETAMATLGAGMDTECGSYLGAKTMALLLQNNASVAKLADAALTRLFDVQMRLGFFDPRDQVPWGRFGPEVVDTPAHRALAREASDQSLVLLKNTGGTLPFSKMTKPVAVVGRNALATTNMLGNYYGTPPFLISPCDGVSASSGVKALCSDGTDGGASTVSAIKAGAVGAVVLVVGLTSEGQEPADEAEGKDRTSLLLPLKQDDLIATVAMVAKEYKLPVALVVMSGGPVDVSDAKGNEAVGAIMWCGYPGQAGGAAIADALFGVTNPSGKLTMTWYPEQFVQEVSLTDMGMRPNASTGNPGRSHRFYTGVPVFAFGEGLSYTSFAVPPPEVALSPGALDTARSEGAAVTRGRSAVVGHIEVRVTNTGARYGAYGVLLFVAPPAPIMARGAPRQSVLDFGKVALAPGTSQTLRFEVKAKDLTHADPRGTRVAPTGEWRFWVGTAADGAKVDANVTRVLLTSALRVEVQP